MGLKQQTDKSNTLKGREINKINKTQIANSTAAVTKAAEHQTSYFEGKEKKKKEGWGGHQHQHGYHRSN